MNVNDYTPVLLILYSTDHYENVFAFEEMYWSVSQCIFKMFFKLI